MFSQKFSRAVGLFVLLGCAACLLLPAGAVAQDAAAKKPVPATMPEGWKEMDAAAFTAAAQAMFKARPRPEASHVKEVTAHAWSTFLNNQKFVETGDWATTRALMSMFIWRRKQMVAGETAEAQEASLKQIEDNLATLDARIRSRLEAKPETVNGISFEELRKSFDLLRRRGFNFSERAGYFAGWMRANDWSTLPVEEQLSLYSILSLKDQIDRECMSVRWTGKISAPIDGNYRFEQVRTYYTDGKMKLWVNGQLVLDSPGVRHETNCYCDIKPEVADEKYISAPVSLSVNKPVDFRLEYVHDMKNAVLRKIYPMGFPVAVLTWQADAVPEQIIPSNAYTPPEGFGEAGQKGLKGEYFADAKFNQKKATRLDPAIDFIWAQRNPVCSPYATERKAIAAANYSKLSSPTYLASREIGETAERFAHTGIVDLAEGLPTAQRLEVLQVLAKQSNLLGYLEYAHITRHARAIYLLPGKEHLELLSAWSKARSQPRTRIAFFQGWRKSFARGSYEKLNYQGPWQLGRLLCRAYYQDTETIWKSHLELPNGECNLALAYATTFATKLTRGKNLRIRKVLDDVLEDEEIKGDRRMTWLLARAYAEEVAIARKPRPGRGNRYLKEAFAAAESPEYRFWALQELVARHIACNRSEEAISLVNSVKGQFQNEGQQKTLAYFTRMAQRCPAHYAKLSEKVRQEAIDAYLAEIARRAEKAEAHGDDALADHYRGILKTAEPESQSNAE